MNNDWKLIWQGLFIASTGAAASMLYIVGVSAAFVARYVVGVVSLALGAALGVLFYRLLSPYLEQLLDPGDDGISKQMRGAPVDAGPSGESS